MSPYNSLPPPPFRSFTVYLYVFFVLRSPQDTKKICISRTSFHLSVGVICRKQDFWFPLSVSPFLPLPFLSSTTSPSSSTRLTFLNSLFQFSFISPVSCLVAFVLRFNRIRIPLFPFLFLSFPFLSSPTSP